MSPSRKASNALLRTWGQDVTGHVLSIGSGTDQDKQGGHYRDYFPQSQSYTTSEPVESPHCDLVVDVRRMPQFTDGTFGAIFCSGVLEHVDDVWAAVDECWRILKQDGLFLVGVPFNQPPHRAPQDFWRFTKDGVRFLLRAFNIDDFRAIGDPAYPTTFWAKARK